MTLHESLNTAEKQKEMNQLLENFNLENIEQNSAKNLICAMKLTHFKRGTKNTLTTNRAMSFLKKQYKDSKNLSGDTLRLVTLLNCFITQETAAIIIDRKHFGQRCREDKNHNGKAPGLSNKEYPKFLAVAFSSKSCFFCLKDGREDGGATVIGLKPKYLSGLFGWDNEEITLRQDKVLHARGSSPKSKMTKSESRAGKSKTDQKTDRLQDPGDGCKVSVVGCKMKDDGEGIDDKNSPATTIDKISKAVSSKVETGIPEWLSCLCDDLISELHKEGYHRTLKTFVNNRIEGLLDNDLVSAKVFLDNVNTCLSTRFKENDQNPSYKYEGTWCLKARGILVQAYQRHANRHNAASNEKVLKTKVEENLARLPIECLEDQYLYLYVIGHQDSFDSTWEAIQRKRRNVFGQSSEWNQTFELNEYWNRLQAAITESCAILKISADEIQLHKSIQPSASLTSTEQGRARLANREANASAAEKEALASYREAKRKIDENFSSNPDKYFSAAASFDKRQKKTL